MWYIWGFCGRFEIARVVFLIQLLVADFLIWYELTAQEGISWPVLWKLLVSFGGCSVATTCSCRKSVVFPVRISMVKGNCDVWPIPIIPRTNVVLKIG